MTPASSSAVTGVGSTETTSPTKPMSTGSPSTTACVRAAVIRPPSSPDRPTARPPCSLIRPTTSGPTCPTSTMRTTSIDCSVVTRRPPRNSLGMPSRVSIEEICGPPPWTTTGQDAAGPQEDHVLGEGPAAGVVDHRVAAVLDHHDVAVELLEPRQRTGEDGDLLRVALGVVLAHDPAGADLLRQPPLGRGLVDPARRGAWGPGAVMSSRPSSRARRRWTGRSSRSWPARRRPSGRRRW